MVSATRASAPVLGLRANTAQFWLLVLVNAFVGALVGLERDILPLLGEEEFGIASRTVLLSFIATFGAIKAVSNYFAGRLGDRYGRRKVLIAGWLFGIPVPLLIIWAPSWGWVVFANVLLGVNQGLAWSTTVVMKIDLVGSRQRGLAMGLNEFAGYLAVAAAAFAAGVIADAYGVRPAPFYLGIAIVTAGLALSLLFVRDTTAHVATETSERAPAQAVSPRRMLLDGAWRDRAFSSCNHVGLVNNLNDGVAWGLFPLLFAQAAMTGTQSALLVAAYPAAWGAAQLATGALSDRHGRKPYIVAGMMVQASALTLITSTGSFDLALTASILLGIGTAMVYPTLLAAIGDVSAPAMRAGAVGMYRMWRDSGYVVGALGAGLIADSLGLHAAIYAAAAATFGAGVLAAARLPETRETAPPAQPHRAPSAAA